MFKKFFALVLAVSMVFSASVVVFADEAETCPDYIEVQLDESTEADYAAFDDWGVPWMHVAFKESIWGLSYYEMGTDYSIRNTHSLVESNIASIDLGKGITGGANIVVPMAGNEEFFPVKVTYKDVKYGYWFPTTYKVMRLEVNKREDVNLVLTEEENYVYEDLAIKVVPASEDLTEQAAAVATDYFFDCLQTATLLLDDTALNAEQYSVDREAGLIVLERSLLTTTGEHQLTIETDCYDGNKTLTFNLLCKEMESLFLEGQSDNGFELGKDLRMVGEGDVIAEYVDSVYKVEVWRLQGREDPEYIGEANYSVEKDGDSSALVLDGSIFEEGEYYLDLFASGYLKSEYASLKFYQQQEETLAVPEIANFIKKRYSGWLLSYDYYEMSFVDDALYTSKINSVKVGDIDYSKALYSMTGTDDYQIDSDKIYLSYDNGFSDTANTAVTITADGYQTFNFEVTPNGELIISENPLLEAPQLKLVGDDPVIVGNATVLTSDDADFSEYLSQINDATVNGEAIGYAVDETQKTITISADDFALGTNEVVFKAEGYQDNVVTVNYAEMPVEDIEPPQYIKIEKHTGGVAPLSYDYYDLTFDDEDYLSKITAVQVASSAYDEVSVMSYFNASNAYDVDLSSSKLYLSLDSAFSADQDNVVIISADGYFDYQFIVNQAAVEEGMLLTPPQANGVSLRVLPNTSAPFVGSVSFDGDSKAIDKYLRAIDSVEVTGTQYSKFSISSVLNFENIMQIISLATAEEFSISDLIATLVDVFGQEYAYYVLPELPTMNDAFAKIKELYNTDYSNSAEIAGLVTSLLADIASYLLEDMVTLDLTADGFNIPTNSTVTITADGYRDMTFTFNAVGQIVSQGEPEESMTAPSVEVFERDILADYCRLTFDGDELDVADYVAKITTIKVNGEYYAKHSSLIFNNAYMLSKVYGDVLGYYVFVDMTVDGFKADEENEILIVAEGYQNLKFTIPSLNDLTQ